MKTPNHVLLNLLFGTQAEAVRANASPRLLAWDAAFDAWLVEANQRSRPEMMQKYAAWRSLLRFVPKPPWEIEPHDLVAWMDATIIQAGYASQTALNHLKLLKNFYQYVHTHELETPAAVDPTEKVQWPRQPKCLPAYSLNQDEIEALLGSIEHEVSVLGKRNYALLMLLLYSGMSFQEVHQARWQELELDPEAGSGSIERPHCPRKCRTELSAEIVAAIHDYLSSSGRLEQMRPDEYLFLTSAWPVAQDALRQPTGWLAGQPVSSMAMNVVIRYHGGKAGLPREKLTINAMRYTSIALLLRSGVDVHAIARFIGTANLKAAWRIAKRVRDVLDENGGDVGPGRRRSSERVDRPGQTAEQTQIGRTHRLTPTIYDDAIPEEELRLLERVQPAGLQAEIDTLRLAMMRTLRQMQEVSAAEQLRLLDGYSSAANRLANLLKTQQELNREGSQTDMRELLEQALRKTQSETGWDLGLGEEE